MMKKKKSCWLPSPARRVAWENPSLRYCWPVSCITAKTCVWRLWTVTSQHSIALMRERDMENVMKNDDLKVNLYRQYERIRKPAYPVIKSDPEKGWKTCGVIWTKKGRLSISCSSTFPERSAARGWFIPLPRWTISLSRSRRTISSCRVPAVYQGAGRGADRQGELQLERNPAVLEHGG